jgi:uncharacterized phage-associated protein
VDKIFIFQGILFILIPEQMFQGIEGANVGLYNMYRKMVAFTKKGEIKVVTALNVANNFIRRAIDENVSLTPMKLQKMIYFLYAAYLCKTSQQLFAERFGTWKYGPVLDTVYQEFKGFGSSSINRYCANDGKVVSVDEKHEIFRQLIDMVWCKYRVYSGIELSKFTHKPESAWYKAYADNQPYLNDQQIEEEGEMVLVA